MATSARWLPQRELRVHPILWDGRHELHERHGLHLRWDWCVDRIHEFGECDAIKLTNCRSICYLVHQQPSRRAREPIRTRFEDCRGQRQAQLDVQHARNVEL